mgnify:CR=1 FL=1
MASKKSRYYACRIYSVGTVKEIVYLTSINSVEYLKNKIGEAIFPTKCFHAVENAILGNFCCKFQKRCQNYGENNKLLRNRKCRCYGNCDDSCWDSRFDCFKSHFELRTLLLDIKMKF